MAKPLQYSLTKYFHNALRHSGPWSSFWGDLDVDLVAGLGFENEKGRLHRMQNGPSDVPAL
jgi:hypothetical protein